MGGTNHGDTVCLEPFLLSDVFLYKYDIFKQCKLAVTSIRYDGMNCLDMGRAYSICMLALLT